MTRRGIRRPAPRRTSGRGNLARIPQVTKAVRDAYYTPPARQLDVGFCIHITDEAVSGTRYEYWDGAVWQPWTPGAPIIPAPP